MPNRMLRDWTSSLKIDAISFQAEIFFIRLIMKVDDYGLFHADPRLLKANLFPLRLEKVREADISRWTAECQKAGLIALYSDDQRTYLQILDFRQRLDRAKAKFPLPSNCGQPPEVVNEIPPELEVELEIEQKKKEREAFRPPDISEVVNQFSEKLDEFSAMAEASKFIDFYQSKGWLIGKTKMKDWKAAARGWLGRMNQFKNEKDGKRKQGTSEARIDALKNF